MQNLLKLEEAAMCLAGFWLFQQTGVAWWWFAVFLLAPDLAMIGYALGPKVGAWAYNLAHHKAVAIAVTALGMLGGMWWLQAAGAILFAHASFDRVFGYGLKYAKGFKYTHLGEIGPNR